MFGLGKKAKSAIKTSGKKLITGEYKVGSKLNRVGQAARNVSGNFVSDFQNDGPNFSISSEVDSPFRMGNTAETLPALQRNRNSPRHKNQHKQRNKRRPRKVVYY